MNDRQTSSHQTSIHHAHDMPFGAELRPDGTVRFRLWAPARDAVSLVLDDPGPLVLPMQAMGEGWFERMTDRAGPATRYRFQVDEHRRVPDPASRFQPDDVNGASAVIDPRAYPWRATGWRGRPWHETVLYELHVGAFSPEGTFEGIRRRLDHLVELGVTAVELMPLSDFPGRRNWGYDGVLPFAPDSAYGHPDELKALIDECHLRGLQVFIDVVYNHFGPEGNHLSSYAGAFFTERHHTPWGAAINFDTPGDGFDASRVVRDFFIDNALYWLIEFRADGLRLDAVHAIIDDSDPHVLHELAQTVRTRIAAGEPGRHVHLVLENDDNAARFLERDDHGRPRCYDAQWNDDFHHAAHVILTGERGGYYADYAGNPVDKLGRALAEGFVHQADTSPYRNGAIRGEPSAHLPPVAFVDFLQNHDQIGNRAFGERLATLVEPRPLRTLATIQLLAPSVPLVFMGEEWAATQPFAFFCDFHDELAQAVRDGRRREFAGFPEFADARALERIPDPNAPDTFERSRLDWHDPDRPPHDDWLGFYRGLLSLRAAEMVPRLPGTGGKASWRCHDHALIVHWHLGDGSRLSLVAVLGPVAVTGLAVPDGRLVAESEPGLHDALRQGRLPGWSALWYLASPLPSTPTP